MIQIAPKEVMAKWPKPNLVNPESQRGLLFGFEIPLIIITVVIMVMRMYTRVVLTRSTGIDDWMMLGATIVGVGMTVLNCMAPSYGWGLHIWDFLPNAHIWLVPARKLAMATEILFVISIGLTKLSILEFYLRIFSDKTFKILVYIGIAYTVMWTITNFFLSIFQCIPVKAFWDYSIAGKCISGFAAITATATLNSISDFYVFCLPLRRVWGIQLPKKQRLGLMAVFALGLIVCIAGCVRIYYTKVVFHDTPDFTWYGTPLYIATCIECNVGIICASLPAIKPLFARMFPKLLGSTIRGNSSRLYDMDGSKRTRPSAAVRSRRSGTYQLSSRDDSRLNQKVAYNSSEEYIMTDDVETGNQHQETIGINKKVDIDIRYSEADIAREAVRACTPEFQEKSPPTTHSPRSQEEEEMRRPRRI